MICHLARVKQFAAAHDTKKPENAATAIVNDMEFYLHIERAPEAERARLEKQKLQVEKAKKAVEAKLADENFVTKAKPEVVAKARGKLAELTEQLETIEKHLAEFNG